MSLVPSSAEISTVICDTAEKAAVLLENVQRGETPGLKTIILMDAFDAPLLDKAQKSGVLVQSLRDVEVRHVQHHIRSPQVI